MLKKAFIGIVFLIVCFVVCVEQSFSLAEAPIIAELINDNKTDVSILIDYLKECQPNLLEQAGYDPSAMKIDGSYSNAYAYKKLYSELEPSRIYLFALDSTLVLEGLTDCVSFRLYDFGTDKELEIRQMEANHETPQAWLVSIPEDVDPASLSILAYAGEAGKTEGVSVLNQNMALYPWPDSELPENVLQSLVPLADTPPHSLQALAAKINNHYTDVSPLHEYAKTQNLLSSSIAIAKDQTVLFDRFEAAGTYLWTVGNTETQAGFPPYSTIRLFDTDTQQEVASQTLSPTSAAPQAWLFTTPSNITNLVLLAEAGKPGETTGNAVEYQDMFLCRFDGTEQEKQIVESLGTRLPLQALDHPLAYIVNMPGSHAAPIQDACMYQQENLLLASVCSQFSLVADENEAYKYNQIFDEWTPGATYEFTLGGSTIEAGTVDGISVRIYDFNTKETLMLRTMRAGIQKPQKWSFTIPEEQDLTNLALIVYAGMYGKTQDNAVSFNKLSLCQIDQNKTNLLEPPAPGFPDAFSISLGEGPIRLSGKLSTGNYLFMINAMTGFSDELGTLSLTLRDNATQEALKETTLDSTTLNPWLFRVTRQYSKGVSLYIEAHDLKKAVPVSFDHMGLYTWKDTKELTALVQALANYYTTKLEE